MNGKLILMALAVLCLLGCSRTDTMVYIPEDVILEAPAGAVIHIPVNPAEQTEPLAQPPETDTQPTEVETETEPKATEAAKKQTTSTKKTSSTKRPSGTSSTKKPAATQPPETQAPVTEPSVTQPSTAEPTATESSTEPPETEPPLYDISGYSVGSLEYEILAQINARRTEAELSELILDSQLCAIASCRSFEISQVWSHTRPDGRGYATVLADYGYGAGSVTELLVYASGSGDAAAMVEKWMNSDSHRETLLSGRSTLGVGIYRANGFTYVTCLLTG